MSDPTPTRKVTRRRRIPPGLLRRRAAAPFLDMGLSTFDRADAAGLIPAGLRVGGCKAWSRKELLAWIDAKCPPRAEWEPVWADLLRRLAHPRR